MFAIAACLISFVILIATAMICIRIMPPRYVGLAIPAGCLAGVTALLGALLTYQP